MKKGYTKGLLRGRNKNIHKSRSKFRIRGKWIRRFGMTACLLLVLFGALAVHPVIPEPMKNAEAAVNPATTTLTVATSGEAAILDITPSSTTGTFSSSDTSGTSLGFSVTTDNITGYNLSIRHASATSPAPLVNEALTLNLDSLETSVTESQFSTSAYVGRYGYRPSKLNSADNSNYIPAPTATATTLNVTSQANTTGASDNYTIALGANIDYTKSAGTYTNTFVLTAVANNVAYSINYNDSTSDTTLANLPATESASEATASYFTLSSTTPTRTGYTFNKWCDGNVTHVTSGNSTCDGNTYEAGDHYSFSSPSATSTNVANLYAMWKADTHSLAIAFAGSGVSSVKVCKTAGNCSGDNLMGTVSSSGGSVSGLTYGVAYYLYPTFSSGYTLSSWSKTSSTGTLSSTTTTNPTFTMGAGNGAVTITGKSSGYTITFKTSNASSINFNGTNYTNNQTVTVAAGTYQIYGNYGTKYAFNTWAKSGSGSFGNSDYQLTTFTVSGDATITLTGQSVTTAMQSLPATSCTNKPKPVYDTRDNEVYWIQKLADGNCWMLDNLRLGGTSTISLTTSNTHVNATKTLPASGTTCFTSDANCDSSGDDTHTGYTVAAINTDSKNIVNTDTTENWGYGSGKYGVYYNYCAASAGTICTASNSSNASYDVCPKGWKMPTGGSTGQYQSLCDTIKGESCSTSWADDGAFHTALSTPLSGYFYLGSAYSQGSYGYFWSSTRYSTPNMYYLRVYSSDVYPQDSYRRYSGFSVRCILGS